MTEEQANEIATRLTIALIEAGKAPFDARQNPTPKHVAQQAAALLLAIRDECLAKPTPEPHA